VLERLLIGVSHQISNRISTLAGVSDILAGDPAVPPILRALADEVPKLEESIRLLRLLAAPEEVEEAVEPGRLLNDALSLARLHPDLRDVVFRVEGDNLPPILAKPTELVHRYVILLVNAGLDGAPEVPVRMDVEGTDVVVSAGESSVSTPTLTAARARSGV